MLSFSYVNIKRPTHKVGQVYTKIDINPEITILRGNRVPDDFYSAGLPDALLKRFIGQSWSGG